MNIKRLLPTAIMLIITTSLLLAACAPAAQATSAPVPILEPTSTPEPMGPAQIVQSFWNAINAQELDAAMVFVADNVTCRGACYLSGKDSLQSFLQGTIDSGISTKISDLQVEGEKVTYTFEYYRNGALQLGGHDSMQVQDGKIVSWNFVKP